jgi:MFS transporter, DHA2 family, multidrug resistance protein
MTASGADHAALPGADVPSALPAQERPAYFTTGWTGGHNPWAIALVVTMATFMEVLDTSIANVSLPHIAGNLSVSQDEGTWVLTSYLVSNAIILPISGWIASKVGRKRFYMSCVAMFAVSSLLCGLAPSLGWLVFFRILQGLGGGGLGPSEQSILADTFPPAKRGMAFALYGMAVVLAPAIGPTLGGFITDHYNWRWVFFINVPVGIASLFLSNHFVTDPPHLKLMKEKSGGIDYIGLSLIALGLGTLEVVLDKGQEDDWFHSTFIVWFVIIAAISLVSFVVWEWNQKHPVVDVRMFKNRNFAASNIMMLTLGVSLFGTTVLLPQYTQVLMGYSAEQAGMALSPGGFVVIMLLPMVGTLVSRVDPRFLIAFGFVVLSASLFYMTTHLYQGIDFKTAILLRVYQSVGLAFLFVPINTLVYTGMPVEKSNSISGIVNLSRNMGGDVGIAFVTTFIARRSQKHQMDLSAHTSPYNQAFAAKMNALVASIQHTGTSATDAVHKATASLYGQLVQQATTLAYIDVLRVMALVTACMIPLLLLTQRPKGGPAPAGH